MNSLPKTKRLISLSWAELGIRFRQALMCDNQFLAAKIKQAIQHKKFVRLARTKGLAAAQAGIKQTL